MSTKTSIKRIALVAVSALGFGLLSVMPAKAALLSTTTAVDALSMTSASTTVRVGDAVSTTFSASFSEDGNGTLFGGAVISLTKPTGSTVTLTNKNGDGTANDPIAQVTSAANMTTTIEDDAANDKTQFKFVPANTASAEAVDTNVAGTVGFTPDRPGTYVVTVTGLTDGGGSAAVANTISATYTVTVRSLSYTTGDAAAASPYNTGTGVAGVANTVTVTAYSTQVADQKALVTVSGAGATIQSSSNATVSADFLSTVVNAAASSVIVVKTPNTGTVTISLFNETAAGSGLYSTTAANTVTITVGAAATNGVYSYATAFISATQGSAPTADDATAIVASASAAARARIAVRQYDNLDTLLVQAQTKAITVAISGVGQLGATNGGATGNYLAVAAAAGTNSGPNDFYVYSDGRSGVGTITIAVNGVTVATKTVTFYGSVASYTLTIKNKQISVGSTADTEVMEVAALDANGVAVPSATVYVSSGTTSVATVDSATVTTSAAGAAADIGINGVAKGTSVITVGNAATSPTVSATATINVVTAGIASVALSFDKAEYTPGEKATLTITAKNADGVAVGDQEYANLFASGGISASSSLTTALDAVSITTVDGIKTYTVYMPLTSGPVTVNATLGASVATAIQATVVSASTTVGASAAEAAAEAATEAAVEATDAANSAYEAAVVATETAEAAVAAAEEAKAAADAATAAVEALATEVSTLLAGLKTQLTTLTNTVAKILRRVKA